METVVVPTMEVAQGGEVAYDRLEYAATSVSTTPVSSLSWGPAALY